MAREPKKLDQLFHDTLKDIYFAEKKILSALPKMAKAARELNVTHGAVSHQIKALEAIFGTPLFERNGKRLKLATALTYDRQLPGTRLFLAPVASIARPASHGLNRVAHAALTPCGWAD